MKRCWILVLLLALGIRVVLAIYWENRLSNTLPYDQKQSQKDKDGPFFFGDSDSYWKLGRALAFGRPYQFDEQRHWTIFRMPGYPALLSPIFKVQGEHPSTLSARLLGCLLGTLTVALVGLLAFELFRSHLIALLAAFLAACEPCSAVQSVLILAEEPFTAAMLIQLYLMAIFFRECEKDSFMKKGIGLAILIGLFSAWTVYFRPSWYYFPPFVFAFLLLALLIKRKRFVKTACKFSALFLIALAVFAVFLSPWVYRNYRLTGKIIPTTLQLGASLYDGLNPQATGASDMKFIEDFRKKELERKSSPGTSPRECALFEVELDQSLQKASLDWVKANPGQAVKLAGVKFLRLWNIVPNEKAFSSPLIKGILILTNVPIILLGLLGCLTLLRRHAMFWLLWLPALYITGLHMIFVSSLRYRTPALFGLMIAAAFVVVEFSSRRTRVDVPRDIKPSDSLLPNKAEAVKENEKSTETP